MRGERHPAGDVLAEAIGGPFDPARPPRGRDVDVVDPAFVGDPSRLTAIVQRRPHLEPDGGGGGENLLVDLDPIEGQLAGFRLQPGPVEGEAEVGDAEVVQQCEVVRPTREEFVPRRRAEVRCVGVTERGRSGERGPASEGHRTSER